MKPKPKTPPPPSGVELLKLVGTSGTYRNAGMTLPVSVDGARKAYGRSELLVTITGTAVQKWIRAHNFTPAPDTLPAKLASRKGVK